MKLSGLMCLLFAINVSAGVNAQPAKVSLEVQDMTISQVLRSLGRKFNKEFFYSDARIDMNSRISVKLEDATIDEALGVVFPGKKVRYEVQDDYVLILEVSDRATAQPQRPETVSGVVTDQAGAPLPGVTVSVKGSVTATSADARGRYTIKLPDQADIVLVFSFIGMQTQEVPYKEQKTINITMKETAADIGEVVVTGMFNKPVDSYTGSVSVISSAEIKSYGNRNILSTLRNIDPAFNIIESNEWGSNPNRLPEINIRGESSLVSSIGDLQSDTRAQLNVPLIILDGFEISLERFNDMNTEEIESITILKDASATSIYGSQGANGVIVITSVPPRMGKLKLSYSGNLNIEAPDLRDYDVLNAREKLELERISGYYDNNLSVSKDLELKGYYNSVLQDILRGVNTDWMSKPVRTGIGQRHNVQLSGGDRSFRYMLGLDYNDVAGVMKKSNRRTFNGTIDISYYHEKFIFRNSFRLGRNDSRESPYGAFSDYVRMNPYWPTHDDKGKLIPYYQGLIFDNGGQVIPNPLYGATLNTKNTSNYVDLNDNFSVEFRPNTSLRFVGKIGVNYKTNESDLFIPGTHPSFETNPDLFTRGSYNYSTGNSLNLSGSLMGQANYLIAKKHLINAGVQLEARQNRSRSYRFSAVGFMRETMDFISMGTAYPEGGKPGGNESTSRSVGFTGNASYTYDQRYVVEGSVRFTGSSKYGAKRKFATHWSVGGAWMLHNEAFMKEVKWINRLRVRGSYGVSGSENFTPYQTTAMFQYYTNDSYGGKLGAYQMAVENPFLTWQQTPQLNIGIELSMLKDWFQVQFDYYDKRSDGVLSQIDLPLENGFTSISANMGKVQNEGLELRVTAFLLKDIERQTTWSVTANLSSNKNIIKELSPIMITNNENNMLGFRTAPVIAYRVGESTRTLYAVRSMGIDPSTGKEILMTKDGKVTYNYSPYDQVACGVQDPRYRGNLNSTFRYKDLSVSISMSYQWGGQVYNNTLIGMVENADKKFNVDRRVFEERWQKPGDRTFFKGINELGSTYTTSRFIQDEATLQFRNVNVTYDFRNKPWLKKAGISLLSVRANVEDLGRLSTIRQERGTSYPFSHNYSLSVNITF